MIRRLARQAVDAFPFPVIAIDRTGRVISANLAATAQNSTTALAVVGHHFADVFYNGLVLDEHQQFLSPIMDTLVREREIFNQPMVIKNNLHHKPTKYLVTTWIMRNRNQSIDMVWGFYVPPDMIPEHLVRNTRIIHTFCEAIGDRDPYTRGHMERVAIYALAIGRTMELDGESLSHLFIASITHDIGKIGVAPEILNKPGRLDPAEITAIRQHSLFSAKILTQFEMPQKVVLTVRHHHERYDGGGYPDNLAGKKIPLLSRVLAVADSFEAMTSDRVYRPCQANLTAMEELARHAGTQFDPAVAEKVLRLAQKMRIHECKSYSECLNGEPCPICVIK